MYIVKTIATVAVEYRSQKRKREHHAKIDEHTNFMYTVNNKRDKHEPQLREFIELCPYANVCTPSSRM